MSGPVSGRRPLLRDGERGAILPVAAVLLTSLLLMSAMVLDIGRLSLERLFGRCV